jgi:hypothetical protein
MLSWNRVVCFDHKCLYMSRGGVTNRIVGAPTKTYDGEKRDHSFVLYTVCIITLFDTSKLGHV